MKDLVHRECVMGFATCSLTNKCDDCKKEMADLIEIDKMFEERWKELKNEYLKLKIDMEFEKFVKEIINYK
jgi:hypothetical protein